MQAFAASYFRDFQIQILNKTNKLIRTVIKIVLKTCFIMKVKRFCVHSRGTQHTKRKVELPLNLSSLPYFSGKIIEHFGASEV